MTDAPRAPLRIAVRVDASARIGTGHLRRCLSLAEACGHLGAALQFVVRPLDDTARHVLSDTPFPTHWLPEAGSADGAVPQPAAADAPPLPPHHAWAGLPWERDAADTVEALRAEPPDWLLVDHYAFDARWHVAVAAGLGCRIAAVDDLADRSLAADVLIDVNWHADHRAKYAGRLHSLPGRAPGRLPRMLTGPRFAMLAEAYRSHPPYRFHAEVRSIGIFMGGTDPGGASARVLHACRAAGYAGPVEVVSSAASPWLQGLQAACAADGQAQLTCDLPHLADFFTRHDLQIGAGGGATWERCCMGAPTIALVLADNQQAVVPALARAGVVREAVLDADVPGPAPASMPLPQVLRQVLDDAQARRSLGDTARALVDGRGAGRIALCLAQSRLRLRPATAADAELLHGWRNAPSVRAVSRDAAPIPLDAHRQWLDRVLADPARWLWVAEVAGRPVGSVRFDSLDAPPQRLPILADGSEDAACKTVEVSLYLDPELMGQGLGAALLAAGEIAMAERFGAGVPLAIHAAVLDSNPASHRMFVQAGYALQTPAARPAAAAVSQQLYLKTLASARAEAGRSNDTP